ncbi:hypothetical protein HK099_007517 [Clydaea vesicula]|uniref:GOLD domain-containing protein n=1 Tax=Clydaea vesicula TaxID=447962 RepID=A0AAD5U167_9FUNG|nr:hypothetical protein HK099_007517 [Clydaea vesicula]
MENGFHEFLNKTDTKVSFQFECSEGSEDFIIFSSVEDPNFVKIYESAGVEEDVFDFVTEVEGEYSFCFFNEAGGKKEVNFNIEIDSDYFENSRDFKGEYTEEARNADTLLNRFVRGSEEKTFLSEEEIFKDDESDLNSLLRLKIFSLDASLNNFTNIIDRVSLERHRNQHVGDILLTNLISWSLIRVWFVICWSACQVYYLKRLFYSKPSKDLKISI